jgi:hypothetical protein
MEAGMQIASSDEHPSNARFPNVDNRQSLSNVRFERLRQELKQHSEMISIDEGTWKDLNDEQHVNALSPKFEILQSSANWILLRPMQQPKHAFSKISTEEGTQIDSSAEQP